MNHILVRSEAKEVPRALIIFAFSLIKGSLKNHLYQDFWINSPSKAQFCASCISHMYKKSSSNKAWTPNYLLVYALRKPTSKAIKRSSLNSYSWCRIILWLRKSFGKKTSCLIDKKVQQIHLYGQMNL